MDKAVIIGAGTYGQVYAAYLRESGKYELIGYLDDEPKLHGEILLGIPVLGSIDYLDVLSKRDLINVFIPLGNNKLRVKLLEDCKSKGYPTPSFIHPTVTVHNSVKFGNAIYILPNTSIMPYTLIEDYVMISMGVNVAHHNSLGKGSFFSQGVNVGASISIGENVFVGIGATIMTGVNSIGKNSVIGAGSVIIKDIAENQVFAGVPGKFIRSV